MATKPFGMIGVMTVGELKQLFESVPDDHFVLVPARDHSYREASIGVNVTFEYSSKYRHMSEHHDDSKPDPDEKVYILKAVVIS